MLLSLAVLLAAVSAQALVLTDSGQDLGNGSHDVALGDLDGDGDLDAFLADSPCVVWLNDGAGNFTDSGQILPSPAYADVVELADLDGDGDLDTFMASESFNTRIWLNDGAGIFSDTGQGLATHTLLGLALGDVDGDGDIDALIPGGLFPSPCTLWLNDGSGQFTASEQTFFSSSQIGLDAVWGDVEGDGDLDALVTSYSGNTHLFLNDGSGTLTESTSPAGVLNTIAIGDLDNDGDLDAFLGGRFGYEANWILLNDGAGNFENTGQALPCESDTLGIQLADIDSDGDLDAFCVNRHENKLWLNNGAGIFSDSGVEIPGSESSQDAAVGDLDSDGDLDIITNGKVWLNRSEAFTQREEVDVAEGGTLILTWDFVGTGTTTYTWTRRLGATLETLAGQTSATLEIENMCYADIGTYVCTAVDSGGAKALYPSPPFHVTMGGFTGMPSMEMWGALLLAGLLAVVGIGFLAVRRTEKAHKDVDSRGPLFP